MYSGSMKPGTSCSWPIRVHMNVVTTEMRLSHWKSLWDGGGHPGVHSICLGEGTSSNLQFFLYHNCHMWGTWRHIWPICGRGTCPAVPPPLPHNYATDALCMCDFKLLIHLSVFQIIGIFPTAYLAEIGLYAFYFGSNNPKRWSTPT